MAGRARILGTGVADLFGRFAASSLLWLLALILWDAPSRSPRALLTGLLRNRRPGEFGPRLARTLLGAIAAFAALYLLYESLPSSQLGTFSAIAIATFLAALVAASLLRSSRS